MKKILLGDELLIIFTLIGDVIFGVDIHNVVSVIEPTKIKTVPLVPEYINRILNYQGRIVTIFDMKKYFNQEDSEKREDKKVVYLKHKEIQIGILVDKVIKIDYASQSHIETLPEDGGGSIESEFCKGIYIPDEDAPGIHLLDTKIILEFIENEDYANVS